MFVPSPLRAAIEQLHSSGLTTPEMARELDVAPTTVSYHLGRLAATRDLTEDERAAPDTDGVRSIISTREAVERLLDEGLSRMAIARELGVAKATVSYHARRLERSIDTRCARRYDWARIQSYYNEGHSVRECIEAFGFSSASWFEAVKRGVIVARPAATPIGVLLISGTYRGRHNLKLRLVREGLKDNVCECCGVSEWLGEPLTLALHHVNGIRNDNRLENLQLLCPNCHSQTDTFAGRRRRLSVDCDPISGADSC